MTRHRCGTADAAKSSSACSPPAWAQLMAARHRKSLVVCRVCHEDIHYGGCPSRQNS
ncbi:hypothetical protein [Streptomyces sp. NPDC059008]|uniref:HNH endonuclease n=1 Tax=Streptomyces sp. NPDC059008 TaxID=3346693 RepID=UPI0036787265